MKYNIRKYISYVPVVAIGLAVVLVLAKSCVILTINLNRTSTDKVGKLRKSCDGEWVTQYDAAGNVEGYQCIEHWVIN